MTFANGGMVTTHLGLGDYGNSVAIQSDGKIYVAGSTFSQQSNFDIALIRYNVDGTLDATFNGNGSAIANLGGRDKGFAAQLQPDGKILVAGSSDSDVALIRYNPDGSLDSSFGEGGYVTTPTRSNFEDFKNEIVLQSDGKILVGGEMGDSTTTYWVFGVVRYNANGSIDSSFGKDGIVTTDIGLSGSSVNPGDCITIQSDGKILVAGTGSSQSGNHFGIVRYNADGSLDLSFGIGGKVVADIGQSSAKDIVVDSSGKIVLVGWGTESTSSKSGIVLARFNSDGSLDYSFGLDRNTLDGTPTFNENSSPVVLDSDVQAVDSELAAANNFNGSTLSLARHDGLNTQDIFAAQSGGTLTTLTPGTYFAVDSVTIGRVTTNSAGTLTLTFNANATQSLVNSAMQQIAYANTSNAPPSTVQIDWTFNDGNTGAQGTGGALSVTGSTTVQITATNDAPVLSTALLDQSVAANAPFSYTVPAGSFTDPDLEILSYSVIMADGTGVPPWLSFNASTRTFSGTPGTGDIGSFDIRVTAKDSANASASDVFHLTVGPPNILPTGAVTISGTPTQGQTLNANTSTLADADGLGILAYQWLNGDGTIVGATGSSYTTSQNEVAGFISVRVYYTDTRGTKESLTSSFTPPIANVNDLPTGSVTITGTPTQGETLTATNTLADADGMGTISYQWKADGTDISNTKGSKFVLTQAEVGKSITVAASYMDGFGTHETVASPATSTVMANTNTVPMLVSGNGKLLGQFYSDLLVQSDGKLLTAGSYTYYVGPAMNADFGLMRYNADGSVDPSFSSDGMVTTNIFVSPSQQASHDILPKITLQSDGRILLAGTSDSDFALVRYNADGTLDTTFSTDGKLTTDVGFLSNDVVCSAAIQSDGKILVAGVTGDYPNQDFALIRYNADGTLDASFSEDGKLTTDIGFQTQDSASSMVLQSDGKILVAGTVGVSLATDFALVRYNADGTLDTTFSEDGKLTTDTFPGGGFDQATSVAMQADGKILVAGYRQQGVSLVRYNPDGSLDTAFSDQVFQTISSFALYQSRVNSITLQSDGKILLVGDCNYVPPSRGNVTRTYIALIRLNEDGSPDATFSADGLVTTGIRSWSSLYGFTASNDIGTHVALTPDGKIVVQGISYREWNYSSDGVLLEYNSDGSLDTLFGSSSVNVFVSYTENTAPVVLGKDVQIYDAELISLGNYSGASITVTRHDGASAEDAFAAKPGGTLGDLITGSPLVVDGRTIGAVAQNENGRLILTFNENAVQDAINSALQQIAYSNNSDNPPQTIQIDWIASDGNDGSQGLGGALNATGITTIEVNGINDLPTGSVTITGTPTQGETLTATNTLADADGMGTIRYQWMADGTTISGATGITLVLEQAQVGKLITVVASYTDGFGTSESATGSTVRVVGNVNDLPTGSVTITGTPTQGETLTATNTLADVDGMGTISYQWKADGTAIAGATGNTLVLEQAQVGKLITVVASYTDGFGTAESVTGSVGKAVDLLAYTWKTHTLLDGVAISGANQTHSTDSRGAAGLTAVVETSVNLTVSRVVPVPEAASTSSAVNLQDAIAILKMIVGLPVNGANQPISPYQTLAADFDGNGTVGLTDAIGVLKHVVGLAAPEPTWHFVNETDTSVPAKTTLNPGTPQTTVTTDLSGTSPVHVGLVGYLSGDVDGSYTGPVGASDLDVTQPGYIATLVGSHAGLSLAQFGV